VIDRYVVPIEVRINALSPDDALVRIREALSEIEWPEIVWPANADCIRLLDDEH
jgi:hypothetical protein